MSDRRYVWGGLAWLLTLQFFVVETVAQLRLPGYSRRLDVISDLGTHVSPAAGLMNASFIAQGVLIALGAVLLTPLLHGLGAKAAGGLLLVAALGVLGIGFAPSDAQSTVHAVAAGAYLVGGGAGLIALAYAVRPRSEALGTALALLGLVGLIGTVFFATAVFGPLGEGGMERVAAYVVPLGLPLTALALWRLGDDWAETAVPEQGAPLTRRQQREQERAQAFDRARERDEALEAAARRAEQRSATAPATPDEDDGYDPDNPWGARRTD